MTELTAELRECARALEWGLRSLVYKAADQLDAAKEEQLRLAAIYTGSEDLISEICDKCCRHPYELDQDDLDEACSQCPVTKLAELIGI